MANPDKKGDNPKRRKISQLLKGEIAPERILNREEAREFLELEGMLANPDQELTEKEINEAIRDFNTSCISYDLDPATATPQEVHAASEKAYQESSVSMTDDEQAAATDKRDRLINNAVAGFEQRTKESSTPVDEEGPTA